jgi:hypothetical protein
MGGDGYNSYHFYYILYKLYEFCLTETEKPEPPQRFLLRPRFWKCLLEKGKVRYLIYYRETFCTEDCQKKLCRAPGLLVFHSSNFVRRSTLFALEFEGSMFDVILFQFFLYFPFDLFNLRHAAFFGKNMSIDNIDVGT